MIDHCRSLTAFSLYPLLVLLPECWHSQSPHWPTIQGTLTDHPAIFILRSMYYFLQLFLSIPTYDVLKIPHLCCKGVKLRIEFRFKFSCQSCDSIQEKFVFPRANFGQFESDRVCRRTFVINRDGRWRVCVQLFCLFTQPLISFNSAPNLWWPERRQLFSHNDRSKLTNLSLLSQSNWFLLLTSRQKTTFTRRNLNCPISVKEDQVEFSSKKLGVN